jgi:DNA invertase Pin-like site-specific DNA recombinase
MIPSVARDSQVKAATYVRMSTERQNYSTDHQRAALTAYAAGLGVEIVREYADEGKSGLDIKRRSGLQSLIHDVQAGGAGYSMILVYDVTRWGRFQDVDEAAYHEHTCRRAGIQVNYCKEHFQNDGSPLATVLKTMKRAMAAEYSRELSEKVFSAQCRFIQKGFKQGGSAGYGFRRLAVTEEGVARSELAHLQRKSAVTDRVVLVPGSHEEVALVRRIYALYLDDGMGDTSIAWLLNAENIQSEFGGRWTRALVNTVLTNRKYDGSLVFNRRSCKLSKPRSRNAPEAWIVNSGAIGMILDEGVFKSAQLERARRAQTFKPEDLLDMLRLCYRTHGRITAKIIVADASIPDPNTFARYFGSLAKAYELAGISHVSPHPFVETKRRIRAFRQAMFEETCTILTRCGKLSNIDPENFVLTIIGGVRVRLETATCRRADRGIPYWHVLAYPNVDFSLIARFDFRNQVVLDYLVIPAHILLNGQIYLRLKTPLLKGCEQFSTLNKVFGVA